MPGAHQGTLITPSPQLDREEKNNKKLVGGDMDTQITHQLPSQAKQT